MNTKDPAVLFYISDWLKSTAEMDSDCRGWYLNLILHNYDKESLPNDVEKLALLAGVKFSEYERFKQVFEHVLKQKFELLECGRISNHKAQTILKNRETFKDKRSDAGKKSYLMKYFAKFFTKEYKNKKINSFVSERIDTNIDTKNEQVIEQMFKHLFELYINEIEIENKDIIESEIKIEIEKSELEKSFEGLVESRKKKGKPMTERAKELVKKKVRELSGGDEQIAIQLLDQAVEKGWDTVWPLQENFKPRQDNKEKIQNVFQEAIDERMNNLKKKVFGYGQ